MPSHLHPRSRMTSSLFGMTVAASFFVVALPHVLPCPAPRVRFADSPHTNADGTRRRRRRSEAAEVKDGIAQFEGTSEDFERLSTAAPAKRECPVPKPDGVIGNLMGFNSHK
jgi:cytochrome c oxidase assembly factor 2